MRTLASVQKIVDLKPIEGADKIEVATVLGWHVVVEKGLYKVGDLVIYCEIDSLMPLKEEFSFLERGGGIKKMLVDGKEVQGYRIKTIRLRGQISQGIVFPLSILPDDEIYDMDEDSEGNICGIMKSNLEGLDVTELLGVYKYEIPVPAQLAGKVRGNFPGFLPKTDETRIQAYPDVLTRYQDVPFYVAEKLDGSSCTFVIKNEEFHVCSRNLDLLDDGGNTLWRLAKEMKIEEKLRKFTEERYAIQGEVIGEGIQKNPLKIKGQKIFFFNVYDFVEGNYLSFKKFIETMKLLDLPTVPIAATDYRLPKTVDEIIAFATKPSMQNMDVLAEGYVFRPLIEQQDPDLGRLSFKAINPIYLLKHEE